MEEEDSFVSGWRHLLMIGEGGIGKTAAMLRCCRDLLEDGKVAVYIPFRKLGDGDSVQCYIRQKVFNKEEWAWTLMEDLIRGRDCSCGTVYLLMDGFNELKEEIRVRIMEELKEFSANGAVRVVISSRRSMEAEGYYDFSAQRVTMQRLKWEKIRHHLEQEGLDLPDRKEMSEILGLPLMLRLYVAIQKNDADYEVNISKVKYLDWRTDMKSSDNMLWNYIQCQIYNACNLDVLNKELIKESIIAAEFLAPFLAAKMNGQQGRYLVSVKEMVGWLDEGLLLFQKSTKPQRLDRTELICCGKSVLDDANPKKMLELLTKKLNLIKENEEGKLSFEHQDFQDVLHLIYIENSIEFPIEPFYRGAFTDVPLPLDVLNMMGGCFSRQQTEALWEAAKEECDGYGVRNAVELWKRVQKYDFADMDFTGCNLQNTSLLNVSLSDKNRHASFCNSRIGWKTFFVNGHQAPITSVVWSPNGGKFVSGAYDSTLRLWNAESGECIEELKGHTHYVRCVAWSPKEDLIVSGSDDRTLRIWNVSSDVSRGETDKTCEALVGHTGWIYCVAWSFDGKRIASGDSEHTLRIWKKEEKASNWQSTVLGGHEGRIKCVAWHPKKGKFCASGASDRTVRIWNTDTGKEKILKGFKKEIVAVVWSEDGTILAVADGEKVFLWDTGIILGNTRKRSWGWKEREEYCLGILEVRDSPISSIVWMDSTIVTADSKMLRIWDIKHILGNRQKKHWFYEDIQDSEKVSLEEMRGAITCLAWSSHEKGLIGGADDSTLRLWKPHNPQWRSRWLYTGIFNGCSLSVRCSAWSPDSKMLAAGYDDNMIRIWNMETGCCFKVLKGHTKRVKCIAWSSDGKWIASGSNDTSVRIWNKEDGELEKRFFHDGAVNCVKWLSDGERIVSGSDDRTIRIWKWRSGKEKILEGHTDSVYSLAFDPQELTMVSGSDDKSLRFWNLEKEEEIKEAVISGAEKSGHQYPVRCVAWSHDKELDMVVSGSNDKTLKRWNAAKRVPWPDSPTLLGHEDFVYCIAWSPDGTYLISGSTDCTLWIWNARSGKKVVRLTGHVGYIWNVAWSPDGHCISSASSDGTIRIWDTSQLKDEKVTCIKELSAIPGLDITGCDFTGASYESREIKEILLMNGGIIREK